jgi:hypothetical protein
MTYHRRVRAVAVSFALLLVGCREAGGPVASPEAAPYADPAPEAAAAAPRAAPLAPPPEAGAYEVADEVVQRRTHLPTAVLIPVVPGDLVGSLFAEAGVRVARLERDDRFGQYACGAADEAAARPWVDVVAYELSRHAPEVVRASRTHWVVFCRGLTQQGTPRPVVPAASGNTILFDVDATGSDDHFRGTVHHELFHMLDGGEVRGAGDRDWMALGGADGGGYGSGGRYARDASGRLGTGPPGFVTAYAQSAPAEDKAEVFRFLAYAPGELRALAERDPVVARKRELMIRRLEPYCAARSDRIACSER